MARRDVRSVLTLAQVGPTGQRRHQTAGHRPIARCPVQLPLTALLPCHTGQLTGIGRGLLVKTCRMTCGTCGPGSLLVTCHLADSDRLA
jgi:hypothetical protein